MITRLPPFVSNQPSGLLSLLGIQQMGQYPGTLGPEYSPDLDMLPWLLAQRESFQIQSDAAINANTNASNRLFTAPPAGFIWLVTNYTIQGAMSAGAGGILHDLAPIVVRNWATTPRVRSLATRSSGVVNSSAAVGREVLVSSDLCVPFVLLRSTDALGARLGGWETGASTLTLEHTATVIELKP